MTNALMKVEDFETTQRVSLALYKSGYFTDVKSEAQAIVKVMAGQELGIPPFASMTGIHIIQGKPVLGSNVIATLVKNDPRYDYRVKQADNTACVLIWFERGEKVGESSFTRQEAAAGNVDKSWDKATGKWKDKHTWKAYPSDMLFARAISRGARRFAPGIFGGSPVYTPDEMGADTDPDGYVIDVEPEPEDVNDFFGLPHGDSQQPPRNSTGPETKPEPQPVADAAESPQKMMSAIKFREWLADNLGFTHEQHVFSTMKLLGIKATPQDADERRRLRELLQSYRHLRDEKGLSQDEVLEFFADEQELTNETDT